MDVVGETFCFPGDTQMFMKEDVANMNAVGRGCSGSHSMGGTMTMIGGTHGDCDASYATDGIAFTGLTADDGTPDGDDSTSSSSRRTVSFVVGSCIVAGVSFLV